MSTMPKRAFFILSPESSGSRYLTSCFIAAGCYGDADHAQRLDTSFDGATDTVVIRRSLPHGYEWPDLDKLLLRFREAEYADVRVVVLLRNQHCTVRSMLEGDENHAKSVREAEWKIAQAMKRISTFVLESGLPFHYLTYETIVHCPELLRRLLREWGLEDANLPAVVGGNWKYA